MADHFGHFLPAELIDQILQLLDPVQLSALCRCSKAWRARAEPLLYGSEQARNRAMEWACIHGGRDTIQKAVTVYGASPSFVRPCKQRCYPRCNKTLILAAMYYQVGAMETLHSLGARLGDAKNSRASHAARMKEVTKQHFAIIRHLHNYSDRHQARRSLADFYVDVLYRDVAFKRTGRRLHKKIDSRLLDPRQVTRFHGCEPMVECLLDRGYLSASKAYSVRGKKRTLLALTLESPRTPMVAILLSRGADVGGLYATKQEHPELYGGETQSSAQALLPLPALSHVMLPMFVGVNALDTTYNDAMECLNILTRRGADINQKAVLPVSEASRHRGLYAKEAYMVATPIMSYIMGNYPHFEVQNDQGYYYPPGKYLMPQLHERLNQLLALGAAVDLDVCETQALYGQGLAMWWDAADDGDNEGQPFLLPPTTTLEMLFDSGYIDFVYYPGRHEVAQILVAHGSGNNHVTRLMLKYTLAGTQGPFDSRASLLSLVDLFKPLVSRQGGPTRFNDLYPPQITRESQEFVFCHYILGLWRQRCISNTSMDVVLEMWSQYCVNINARMDDIDNLHGPGLGRPPFCHSDCCSVYYYAIDGDNQSTNSGAYANADAAESRGAQNEENQLQGGDGRDMGELDSTKDGQSMGQDGGHRGGSNGSKGDKDNKCTGGLSTASRAAQQLHQRLRNIHLPDHRSLPWHNLGLSHPPRINLWPLPPYHRQVRTSTLRFCSRVGRQRQHRKGKEWEENETDWVYSDSPHPTLLHALCRQWNAEVRFSDYCCHRVCMVAAEDATTLLTFLVMRGADPTLRWNGLTARDVLLENLDEKAMRNDPGREYLERLASVMMSLRKMNKAAQH